MQHYDSDILDDYLRGELAPERDAAVHAHLDSCPDCRRLHEDGVALRDWIRAAARAEEREFPAGVAASVWAEIRNPVPSPLERLRRLWRPLLAVPVAAAVVALGVFFTPLRPVTVQKVAAAYYIEAHNARAAENPFADRSIVTAASVITADRSAALPFVDASDITSANGSAPAQ